MAREFITAKGTKLELISLQGKDYLPVNQRVLWFRETHADYQIVTEPLVIKMDQSSKDLLESGISPEFYAIFRATISDNEGKVLSTATKYESLKGFSDFVEKAETGAIGRALALAGFGTQFSPEFGEGDRNVDMALGKTAESKPLADSLVMQDIEKPVRKVSSLA